MFGLPQRALVRVSIWSEKETQNQSFEFFFLMDEADRLQNRLSSPHLCISGPIRSGDRDPTGKSPRGSHPAGTVDNLSREKGGMCEWHCA